MKQDLSQRLLPVKRLGSGVRPFEVVVACNLEHPYRFSQEYWWLEILAENMNDAAAVARDWVLSPDGETFEYTNWVREAAPHKKYKNINGKELPIFWGAPTPQNPSRGLAIRNPATGKRLGFTMARDLITEDLVEDFWLLSKRPNKSSEAIALVPLVWEI